MLEPRIVKVAIAREQSRTTQGVKKRDNFLTVIHPEATDFTANSSEMNAPTFELSALQNV
jgi:hypothetical protein